MGTDQSSRSAQPVGAEPTCVNSTPGGGALDGALPASACSLANYDFHFRSRKSGPPVSGCLPAAALSTAIRNGDTRPLTLFVANGAVPDEMSDVLPKAMTASTRVASTTRAFPVKSAFHRRVPEDRLRVLRARHRSRGFAAVESASDALSLIRALAWMG